MSGINGRLRGINVSSDAQGRVPMDQARLAEVRAGKSNIGIGDILIFDFDGDPKKISKADNDRTDNVRVEVKTVRGKGRESVTMYTIGKVGDDKIDKDGDAPFEGIREGVDAARHLNVAHLRCETSDGHMQCYFRQVRITDEGTFTSEWIGAEDGGGLRVGRQ